MYFAPLHTYPVQRGLLPSLLKRCPTNGRRTGRKEALAARQRGILSLLQLTYRCKAGFDRTSNGSLIYWAPPVLSFSAQLLPFSNQPDHQYWLMDNNRTSNC